MHPLPQHSTIPSAPQHTPYAAACFTPLRPTPPHPRSPSRANLARTWTQHANASSLGRRQKTLLARDRPILIEDDDAGSEQKRCARRIGVPLPTRCRLTTASAEAEKGIPSGLGGGDDGGKDRPVGEVGEGTEALIVPLPRGTKGSDRRIGVPLFAR